ADLGAEIFGGHLELLHRLLGALLGEEFFGGSEVALRLPVIEPARRRQGGLGDRAAVARGPLEAEQQARAVAGGAERCLRRDRRRSLRAISRPRLRARRSAGIARAPGRAPLAIACLDPYHDSGWPGRISRGFAIRSGPLSDGDLSSRNPWKLGWRIFPSSVHS